MTTLLCFGLGYSVEHYLAEFGGQFARIVGAVRSPETAVSAAGSNRLDIIGFTDRAAVDLALETATHILVSAPAADGRDPALASHADAIGNAPRLQSIVYLSSIGVYGDHGGATIDETVAAEPDSERTAARLAAETAWRELGHAVDKPVAVLRLAGIYGPGRNALVNLKQGTAKRIVKPGQVFNRIHVADIAQAIDASFARHANGLYNVADDEASPPQDVVTFAAGLLGIAPPPEIPFVQASLTMSPMARSFYASNKRASNVKLKSELGVTLRYPTYREALRALHSDGL